MGLKVHFQVKFEFNYAMPDFTFTFFNIYCVDFQSEIFPLNFLAVVGPVAHYSSSLCCSDDRSLLAKSTNGIDNSRYQSILQYQRLRKD